MARAGYQLNFQMITDTLGRQTAKCMIQRLDRHHRELVGNRALGRGQPTQLRMKLERPPDLGIALRLPRLLRGFTRACPQARRNSDNLSWELETAIGLRHDHRQISRFRRRLSPAQKMLLTTQLVWAVGIQPGGTS